MYGFLKRRFGKADPEKTCLVRTARNCGECLYSGTLTGMRGICRKCGKYREAEMCSGVSSMEVSNAAYSG